MKEPAIAATLSVIPGFGQLFNGEVRKGLLFLSVGIANLLLIWIALDGASIVGALNQFAQSFGIELNKEVISALAHLHVPVWLPISMTVVYALYCANDAYHGAKIKSTEPAPAPKFSELLAFSYVSHCLVLAIAAGTAFVGAFKPPEKQITVFEFVLQDAAEEENDKSDRIADKSSKAHGKKEDERDNKLHEPGAPVIASAAAEAMNKPTEKTPPPTEANDPTPQVVDQPKPVKKEKEEPKDDKNKGVAKPIVKEEPKRRIAQQPRQAQRKVAQRKPQQSKPKIARQNDRGQSPVTSNNMGRTLVTDRNIDDRPTSYDTTASPSYGAYMSYMHRVLKRNWDPPGGFSGRCVVVGFKVSPSGQLSSLHLVRSCGNGRFDRAALQAVRTAAPFRPLPAGSEGPMNIEFTFDYYLATR